MNVRHALHLLQQAADAARAAVYESYEDAVRSQKAPYEAARDNDTGGADHSRRGKSCDGSKL